MNISVNNDEKHIPRRHNSARFTNVKVSIPKNDYVQPTEIRDKTVQRICDAFLSGRTCLTSSGAVGLLATTREHDEYMFATCSDAYRVRGVEMQAAFFILINAGYHMFVENHVGSKKYLCSKRPHVAGYVEVFEFNDFID